MTTKAVYKDGRWILNGRKIWVSRMPQADFTIAMAVTDPEKGSRGGITAFLVDKDAVGMRIGQEFPMLGGHRTYEVIFENCELPEAQVLGKIGDGFGPMQ